MGLSNVVVPFVACGDLNGFDADKSYPLQLSALPVVEESFKGKEGLDGADDADAVEGDGEEAVYVYSYRKPVQPPIRPNYYTYQQTKQQGSGRQQEGGKVTLDI